MVEIVGEDQALVVLRFSGVGMHMLFVKFSNLAVACITVCAVWLKTVQYMCNLSPIVYRQYVLQHRLTYVNT